MMQLAIDFLDLLVCDWMREDDARGPKDVLEHYAVNFEYFPICDSTCKRMEMLTETVKTGLAVKDLENGDEKGYFGGAEVDPFPHLR